MSNGSTVESITTGTEKLTRNGNRGIDFGFNENLIKGSGGLVDRLVIVQIVDYNLVSGGDGGWLLAGSSEVVTEIRGLRLLLWVG